MRLRVLSDDLPATEWQRVRTLQRENPYAAFHAASPATLTDDLSADAWQWVRERQIRGLAPPPTSAGSVRRVALAASPPDTEVEGVVVNGLRPPAKAPPRPPAPTGPLRGRPGPAAMVAGALNSIASGPNRSESIEIDGVKGRVSRGAGRDVRAEGRVPGINVPVGASGVLDAPSGRAEISVSGVKGRGIGLPDRIRIYMTPTGELDFDLPGPIRLGPIPILKKGTYAIGTRDRPTPRK